jgi:hypothetical protein
MARQAAPSKTYMTVYTFDTNHQEYGFNAFCTKLYLRLRHSNIEYEVKIGTRNQAPKSKVPYVRFEDTGEYMGDTSLIIKTLISKGKMEDLNSKLAPQTRAADVCLRSMIEDRMYYFLVSPSVPAFVRVVQHAGAAD